MVHEPTREVAAMLAVQIPLGLTVTVYEVIAAPPFERGSCHATVAVVLGSAVTCASRGADGVVVGTVTVVPPPGVNELLRALASPGPIPFTARRLT